MPKLPIILFLLFLNPLGLKSQAQQLEGTWRVKKLKFRPASITPMNSPAVQQSTTISKKDKKTISLLDHYFRIALNEQYKEDGYLKMDAWGQSETNLLGELSHGNFKYDPVQKVLTLYHGKHPRQFKIKRLNRRKIVFARNQQEFRKLILTKSI